MSSTEQNSTQNKTMSNDPPQQKGILGEVADFVTAPFKEIASSVGSLGAPVNPRSMNPGIQAQELADAKTNPPVVKPAGSADFYQAQFRDEWANAPTQVSRDL